MTPIPINFSTVASITNAESGINFSSEFPNYGIIYNDSIIFPMLMENNGRTALTGIVLIIYYPDSNIWNLWKTLGVSSTDRAYTSTYGSFFVRSGNMLYWSTYKARHGIPIPGFINSNSVNFFPFAFSYDSPSSLCSSFSLYYPAFIFPNYYWLNLSTLVGVNLLTGTKIGDYKPYSCTQNGNYMSMGNCGFSGIMYDGYYSFGISNDNYVHYYEIETDFLGKFNCTPSGYPISNYQISAVKTSISVPRSGYYPAASDDNRYQFSFIPIAYGSSFVFSSSFIGTQIQFSNASSYINYPCAALYKGNIYALGSPGTQLQIWKTSLPVSSYLPYYTPGFIQYGAGWASPTFNNKVTVQSHNYLINHSRPISALGTFKT